MAAPKSATASIRLLINAASAKPAPPVGPALGQAGLNIMAFCKEFNARTSGYKEGVPLRVNIQVRRREVEAGQGLAWPGPLARAVCPQQGREVASPNASTRCGASQVPVLKHLLQAGTAHEAVPPPSRCTRTRVMSGA